jgi:homoserine O-acetyltransferase
MTMAAAKQTASNETRTFTTRDFRLQSGVVMGEVTIAYRTLGTLSPARDNVVLVTHGNTSGPQMIDPNGSAAEGAWNEIVGPGKAVDTNRFFAICPNMLGSSYGSTNAESIDPKTGTRCGPRFPDITVRDIVATQRALLDELGIAKLVAVVGPSYGGFQAFRPFSGRWIIRTICAASPPSSPRPSCRASAPRAMSRGCSPRCRKTRTGTAAIITTMAACARA